MADSGEFDSIAVVRMLEAFQRSLSADSDNSGDADFVGSILERSLKEKFERDRTSSDLTDKGREAELRDFDVTFLMVKEANRALKDRRPDRAIEFVQRALALWSGEATAPKGK